jgi:hypothetical protein
VLFGSVDTGDVLHIDIPFCKWFEYMPVENPRAIGLPALVLGMLTLGSSVSALLRASYAWTSLSGIANIAGVIGGLALIPIGIAIFQQWGEFAID